MNLKGRIENYLWKTFYQRIYPITARDILRATNYLMRLFREAKKVREKDEERRDNEKKIKLSKL